MVSSKNLRVAGSLSATTFLIVLAFLAAPVGAVAIEVPAIDGDGLLHARIVVDDDDRLPGMRLQLHFICDDSGAFTETYPLIVGTARDHAVLLSLTDLTSAVSGYGYGYQASQTGYGFHAGSHGTPTGDHSTVGYGYGYGYGGQTRTDGSIDVVFGFIPAAFTADESCTVVIGVSFGGVLSGDFESPRSAP
ncbi:MAG: hypothetical protein QOC71_1986, partial [Thermoplasmata archaeon]|nr:hypothetical protein [Thermoplasmata archaeon]